MSVIFFWSELSPRCQFFFLPLTLPYIVSAITAGYVRAGIFTCRGLSNALPITHITYYIQTVCSDSLLNIYTFQILTNKIPDLAWNINICQWIKVMTLYICILSLRKIIALSIHTHVYQVHNEKLIIIIIIIVFYVYYQRPF